MQEDKEPDGITKAEAYFNRKCKKRKSEALDFGSMKNDNVDYTCD